ncbi:unnamed protein product, partial [Discosporangium mesarthrocarpum]
DINQDGFGDLVIGAPGFGDDAGVVYIFFGAESFPQHNYLGDLDGSNGFVLTGPSSGGLVGFSVDGAGDINQDSYPDLVVGAHGSGVAGEAYIVFPSLNG